MALEKIVPIPAVNATVEDVILFLKLELLKNGFTEITPVTKDYITALQYNSLILEFKVNNSKYSTLASIELNDGTIETLGSLNIDTSSGTTNAKMDRGTFLYLVKTNDMLMLNLADYNSYIGKGTFTVFNAVKENIEICYLAKSSKIYSTESLSCKLLPKRTYAKAEDDFFLDDVLPVVRSANNEFIVDLTDLVTLGGAKAQNFYRMTNGDKYYCLDDNIAVKIDGQITD